MKKMKNDNTVPSERGGKSTSVKITATAQPAPRIASEEKILECFRHDLRADGFAGELDTACAMYLVLTSRILERPVSAAVKGESAGGKSHNVDSVASFFPKRATLFMTSVSDKALFHIKESLEHRVLVFGEQHGMKGDKLEYLLRELMSRGYIEDRSSRPTKGGFSAKPKRTKGPTSFVTTSTIDLHPENETRLLTLHIDESREATADVMQSVARRFDGSQTKTEGHFTKKEWRDYQTWLASQSATINIPYAQTLASLIDPSSIRLRRDIEKLFSLIAVHALLHRKSRDTDARGVLAKIADYRAVWKILRSVFALSMERSIDATVRGTVEAVESMGSATVTMDSLAKHLGIDKSNAARRYQKAEAAGFLMNRGAGPGRPYAIALAAALPADDAVLPSPRALARAINAARRGK